MSAVDKVTLPGRQCHVFHPFLSQPFQGIIYYYKKFKNKNNGFRLSRHTVNPECLTTDFNFYRTHRMMIFLEELEVKTDSYNKNVLLRIKVTSKILESNLEMRMASYLRYTSFQCYRHLNYN